MLDQYSIDLNVRIVSDLIPGRYYIQVRRVSGTGGRGDYTIGVSRP